MQTPYHGDRGPGERPTAPPVTPPSERRREPRQPRKSPRHGRSRATNEEIVAAATAACAHDFIIGFERGYDTPCGENGTRLSGGQRKRIAIARAFVKVSPTILRDPGQAMYSLTPMSV